MVIPHHGGQGGGAAHQAQDETRRPGDVPGRGREEGGASQGPGQAVQHQGRRQDELQRVAEPHDIISFQEDDGLV